MARVQAHPILSQLRSARSHSEQATALRSLKDEIVGHVQRKERWIECGVLEPIVKILQHTRSVPRQTLAEAGAAAGGQPGSLSEDDLVRLQALQILASFANGGPSFLAPIHASGALPVILSNISPLDNPPQVVLAAIRALCNIAEAASLASPGIEDSATLAETLFASRHLEALNAILIAAPNTSLVQEQKCIVASLISQLCKETQHQNALANAGILDALATILASLVVSRGEVVPGAEMLGQSDGLADFMPDPAPRGIKLPVILEAISTIISDSRFRACMLLSSPAIMAVFPSVEFLSSGKEAKAAWSTLEIAGLSTIRAKSPGAMDYLLPMVPVYQPRVPSHAVQFPPLGYTVSSENLAYGGRASQGKTATWDSSRMDSISSNGDADTDDPESPFIPWLIYLIRTTVGFERVLAASVLASLFKAGFASPEREAAIALLVVPVLCQLIKEHTKEKPAATSESSIVGKDSIAEWAILERIPAVLARLVADNEFLQQAAYDCGVVKMACKCLKDTYEPLPAQIAPRPWSPNPDRGVDRVEGLSTCRMGQAGHLPIYAHRIRMRESSLKLIAAMISFKEEYRNAFVAQDIVPCVVESLSPSPKKPRGDKEKPKGDKGDEVAPGSGTKLSPYGNNPQSVIVATCHVLRILGRSVSILRTHLEDNGVAMPLFRLLKHPDSEVQIAACGAICNLLTEFSPMREPLVEAGILRVLCEHAHSLNAGLRLNAMWALKHLVYAADNVLKKQSLEELESGWLVQLICDDTEDEALHARMKLERRVADDHGDDDDEDEDMDAEAYDDEGSRSWVWPALHKASSGRPSPLRSQSARLQRAERKLAALRETDLNPTRKARNDDLAIQEQGLNFIRNLIMPPTSCGAGAETSQDLTEMVDYVFTELGPDRLFEILASKLRVKVLHPFARRYSAGRDSRVLYPQAKVIEAVVYILVNIAASVPRHRQLVIAQTELLRQVAGHFTSKDIDVRRALCHLLTNLCWLDDLDDQQACLQRALELKRLGFLTKLEGLEHEDGELDIRERARAAVWQMRMGNS